MSCSLRVINNIKSYIKSYIVREKLSSVIMAVIKYGDKVVFSKI